MTTRSICSLLEAPSGPTGRAARRLWIGTVLAKAATGAAALSQCARRNSRRSLLSERDWRWRRAQAHQMADREHQVGAVHGVEMQRLDAVVAEIDHLPGAPRRRDKAACRWIILKPIEPVREPLRHARPRSP